MSSSPERKNPATNSQFKSISSEIFLYQPDLTKESSPNSTSDPDVIIIYGWGDASLKHVSKYTAGFHKLFPLSKIIIVISPIWKLMTFSMDQRARSMIPVINEAFGPELSTEKQAQRTILIHALSNTGGMNAAIMFEAYRRKYLRPMPHNLFIMDSCPGSIAYNIANIKRLAFAMTVGTAAFFPWPNVITQGI
jgi:hypothetical protein